MKTKRLSDIDDVATAGARAARQAYGLEPTDSRTFDAQKGSSVYEVKTARMAMPSGERGRFQIFRDQHTRLRNRDNGGSAWYIFVAITGSTARMVRKNPARIGKLIAARGGFRDMGHTSGPRHRLPISALFNV